MADKKLLLLVLFGFSAGLSPAAGYRLKLAGEALGLGLPYLFVSGLHMYLAAFIGAAFGIYFALAGVPRAGAGVSAAAFLAAFAAGAFFNRFFEPYRESGTWSTGFLPLEVLISAGAAIACFAVFLAVSRLGAAALQANMAAAAAGSKEMVVVFKKGTAPETAEGILKAYARPFRKGADSSRGKQYFYAAGPEFLVAAGADGAEKLKRELSAKPEVQEIYEADNGVQKD